MSSSMRSPRSERRRQAWIAVTRLALGLVLGLGVLNLLAWRQARALTTFLPASGTPAPRGFLDTLSGTLPSKPVNRRTPADLGLSFETLHCPGALSSTLEIWRLPTLLMQGDRDDTIPMEASQAIHRALGPQAVFHAFPGLGHALYVNQRRGEWREAVEQFLR